MVTTALFSTLYGLLAGYLLGLVIVNRNVWMGDWDFSATLPLILAWLAGVTAGLVATGISRWISWRVWLGLITPQVFAHKIGSIGSINVALMAGMMASLIGMGFMPFCFLGLLFMGLGIRFGFIDRAGEWGKVWSLILIGGLGMVLAPMILTGHWLGLALGLALGCWAGITWGSAPPGIFISWVGLLFGLMIYGYDDWLVGWLGLSTGFGLGIIPGLMGSGIEAGEAYRYRSWYVWWRQQPLLDRVLEAIRLAQTLRPALRATWAEPLLRLARQEERPEESPGDMVAALKSPQWVERLVARHTLIRLGGEMAEDLAGLELGQAKEVVIWLLTSIEQETTRQFAWRTSQVICPRCLTRFGRRSVHLSLALSFNYYGCRSCGQSWEFMECPGGVAVVLDSAWQTEPYRLQDGLLRVNWPVRRELCDFDRVEIGQVTDEEVERFAVQAGNDTDRMRQSLYKQIPCRVGSASELSDNTLRILGSIFGRVERISNPISQ
jgi:hypothetical protein